MPHFAECGVNIRAFDEAILQAAIDAMFALEDEPASVRAVSDGYACRVKVELLNRNPAWPQSAKTDDLIELWMQTAHTLRLPLRAEPGWPERRKLSVPLCAYLLDGLGPFGLNGHSSERNPDGSKLPEYVVVSSFLEMGAINVAAIRELRGAMKLEAEQFTIKLPRPFRIAHGSSLTRETILVHIHGEGIDAYGEMGFATILSFNGGSFTELAELDWAKGRSCCVGK